MKFLNTLIWLFPILFMFQDFEEIIMINPWKKKYAQYIDSMKKKGKYVPYPFIGTTASFSIGVLIEFVVINAVCIFSSLFDNYIVWTGLFIGFTLHLFAHIFLCLKFKKYVPGITTSIILIPICILLLYKCEIFSLFTFKDLLISIISATLLVLAIVYILHKLVKHFDVWLKNYSMKSND